MAEKDLFVEQIENGKIVFVTWCSIIQYGSFFYGRQISFSNLVPKGYLVKIKTEDCTEDGGDFFIETEDPKNDNRIEILRLEDSPVSFN